MRRSLACVLMMLLMALLLPASPADDTTDSPAKKDPASKPSKKTVKGKTRTDLLAGKLIRIEPTQSYLTLQVTNKIPQDNAGAAQNIANLQRQLIGNRDINSIRNIKIEIMKNQENLVTFKDNVKNIELSLDDDLKVRTLLLPVEYDDKGRPRKLTEKEKKALKGPDPKTPGYESDFDSLKPNQMLEVYLARPKGGQRAKAKEKDAPADSKDRQKAIMIVIVSEPVK